VHNHTFIDSYTPTDYSTDLQKPVLTVLDNLICYEVSGEDASTFLQGQFSNDVSDVSEENAQLTSYSTPKGRMLAIFYICKRTDSYLLITSSDIADDVIKRLQMFIMHSKVTISKLNDHQLFGLSNDNNSIVLKSFDIQPPINDYQCFANEHANCIKIPGIVNRYLLLGDQALVDKALQIDKEEIYFFRYQYWQWLDVLAGLPMVNAGTQEAFVPQMANMELINGVSFSKGCYPGQEIVARLHYLGDASRRMFRVEVDSDQTLQAGDSIYSTKTHQEVGKFVTTVKVSDNKYQGLAVLRIEAANDHDLSIDKETLQTVLIMDLPYKIPTENEEKTS